MSDKVSIKESKCLWCDVGHDNELCMVLSSMVSGISSWVIFYRLNTVKDGFNTYSFDVLGDETKKYRVKNDLQKFAARVPYIEEFLKEPFDTPEELLKAFGRIVNSE